jgi:hypothetical protein
MHAIDRHLLHRPCLQLSPVRSEPAFENTKLQEHRPWLTLNVTTQSSLSCPLVDTTHHGMVSLEGLEGLEQCKSLLRGKRAVKLSSLTSCSLGLIRSSLSFCTSRANTASGAAVLSIQFCCMSVTVPFEEWFRTYGLDGHYDATANFEEVVLHCVSKSQTA